MEQYKYNYDEECRACINIKCPCHWGCVHTVRRCCMEAALCCTTCSTYMAISCSHPTHHMTVLRRLRCLYDCVVYYSKSSLNVVVTNHPFHQLAWWLQKYPVSRPLYTNRSQVATFPIFFLNHCQGIEWTYSHTIGRMFLKKAFLKLKTGCCVTVYERNMHAMEDA